MCPRRSPCRAPAALVPLTGTVDAQRDAVLHLTVHGPAVSEALEAIVDTGYNVSLLVPAEVAARHGLVTVSSIAAALADSTVVRLQVALAEVDWLSRRSPVLVGIAPSDDCCRHHRRTPPEADADSSRDSPVDAKRPLLTSQKGSC